MDTGRGAGQIDELAAQADATAVVVCDHGTELPCTGQPPIMPCRPIRKTLPGVLSGRHMASGTINLDASGTINLDATPADLGIDDSVPPQ